MPLHPQCRAVLEQMARLGTKPLEQMSVGEARATRVEREKAVIALGGPPQQVTRVEDWVIRVSEQSVPIRIYWPSVEEQLPILLYFHGGGWVFGNTDTVDRPCRHLANSAGCMVISVDYPLAPEHKFPVPVEAAYQTLEYVAAHAAELGGDSTRIALGGESAGANLATVLALMSRDRGGPTALFQLLVYPVTDYSDDRPSMTEYGDGHFLTRAGMKWFWSHYLAEPQDGLHPLASPMEMNPLTGLPPAMIITAECDPLRDQGEAYAARLQEAAVPVLLKRYDGAIHGFFQMGATVDAAAQALADAAQALRQAFHICDTGN